MNKEPVISGRMMFYGESALHTTFLRVTLKDDPDLDLLQKAVDEAVRHYPWVTYAYDRTNAILSRTVSLDRLPFTFVCSYAFRFLDESYLDLVEQMYVMNPAYGPVHVLEIIAMSDQFCISLSQNSSTDVYIRAFMEQLELNGISASLGLLHCQALSAPC